MAENIRSALRELVNLQDTITTMLENSVAGWEKSAQWHEFEQLKRQREAMIEDIVRRCDK